MKKHAFWLAIAAAIVTCVFGVVYVAVQQSLRQGANEPQASMAKDFADQLDAGASPQSPPLLRVDMGRNMGPFLIVYDRLGQVVSGTGYIDNRVPRVPIGVLKAATTRRNNAVTWEPKQGVRIAAVAVKAQGYYVLGGRSLFIVESKVTTITVWMGIAWVTTLGLLAVSYIYAFSRPGTHKAPNHKPRGKA